MALPLLTQEQLQACLDKKVIHYDVVDLGCSVKLRAVTVAERDEILTLCSETGKPGGPIDGQKLVRLVTLKGLLEPALTAEQLGQLPAGALDDLCNKILDLSGLRKGAGTIADVTFRSGT